MALEAGGDFSINGKMADLVYSKTSKLTIAFHNVQNTSKILVATSFLPAYSTILGGTYYGYNSYLSDQLRNYVSTFTLPIPQREGRYIISISFVNEAGELGATVVKSVEYDITVPFIESVEIIPNPVNVGSSFIIKAKIS